MHIEGVHQRRWRSECGAFWNSFKVKYFLYQSWFHKSFSAMMWVCNEDLKEVLNTKKNGKKNSAACQQDRTFIYTSSNEIDGSVGTWAALKLGRINLRGTNGATVIQVSHNCILLPRWLDPRYDPNVPHIRHMLFRSQPCPGNCIPCWGTWPPQFEKCVNNDICGPWTISQVDLSYQLPVIFFSFYLQFPVW